MGIRTILSNWDYVFPTFIRRRMPKKTLLALVIFMCLVPTILLYTHQQRHNVSTSSLGYNVPLLFKPEPGPIIIVNDDIDKNKNSDKNKNAEISSKTGGGSETASEAEQKCVVPKLDVDDPVMLNFLKVPKPIRCKDSGNDWVTIQNGTLVYSSRAVNQFGNFSCDLHPFVRGRNDDTIMWGDWIKNVPDRSKVTSDYFKVECKSAGGKRFSQVRHAFSDKPEIVSRMKTFRAKGINSEDNPSVLILGFDSMSRMSWLRRLVKTRKFFVESLGGIELKGYNIMGDGTPAALFPLLTGKHEQEMPEARRNFPKAKPVDGFPWIWKDFSKAGYITSWGDSEVNIAPFNMRLLGFKDSPTDYYMRPYLTGVNKEMRPTSSLCQGSLPKHVDWLNRVRDLFYKYGDYPKFVFQFYNSLSHGFDNGIMLADDDLHELLVNLHTKGYFNHTLVILMGDHGTRFSDVRGTWSGKLEERLPYMSFLFPQSFQKKHPEAMANFKTNVDRLTTPLDIHQTLLDFLHFKGDVTKGDYLHNRAISLFKEIPLERSCQHANISSHWCACLEWKSVPVSDPTVVWAANIVVEKINSLTEPYRELCAQLKVQDITYALKLSANKDMIKFKKSKDRHGLIPEFAEQKLINQEDLYQLTLHTSPSGGYFEATVSHNVNHNVMIVREKEISRINKYGDASSCVLDKNRQLRQYCYCNESKV